VHIFLDEIHVRKGWQTELKYYLDAHSACKFIVSGSSKNLLYKDASESLVGRIMFVDVFPLTFREFVAFNGVRTGGLDARMDDFQELEKAYFSVITQKERLIYLLNLYLDVGGYPEWFKVCNIERWYRVLAEDHFSLAQSKIPVKYTQRFLFFAPSRLRKGAETRRVLSIAVFTSFVLLYIQLTIDGNHWISRQCLSR